MKKNVKGNNTMAIKISMEHFLSSCGHNENESPLTEEEVSNVTKMAECCSEIVKHLFNVVDELDNELDKEGNKKFPIGFTALAFMHVAMYLVYDPDITKEAEQGDFMVDFFQKMCKAERKDALKERYYDAGVVPIDEED
tara:strand:+ start:672 stop:1088 length:417 start_codon:yes stop_codon:yes gene_type:complete